jgi:AcrR family transcriptional regulator
MPRPLTRQQSQARTRERLLRSARRAFARNGLEGTSIEQVAQGAGHTRGAFYAHFQGRDELYLALLEQWFERYLEEFGRVLATDDAPRVRARRAGDHFSAVTEADPEGQRLFFEFAAYALRNERFRRELVERLRSVRERVAAIFRERADEYGISSPIPYERLALMTFVMSIGTSLDRLLEPDGVPDELYGEMLATLFAGLGAG